MNTRVAIVAAVVIVFLALSGFLIFRSVSGDGQARSLDVTITGNKMDPAQLTARQGDRVTMSVTTDKKEEIHLHGYDIKFEGVPGQKVTMTFTADKTGTFTIEIEDTGTELGSLVVSP